MKHKLFTTLLVMLMSMTASNALAQDYDVSAENEDEITIYYKLINEGAELEVVKGDGYSASTIRIPAEVNSKPVVRIGESAFEGCSELTSVNLPYSLKEIGSFAFYGTTLSSINIPNSVTHVGYGSFGATNIESFYLPESVINIGGFNGDIYRYNPVFRCHKLKEIIVSPNNTKYDSRNGFNGIIETSTGRLISVAPAKNIVIPGFVKTISFGTFAGNVPVYDTSIDSVIIEEGVESIEQIAIYGVHLKKLVIPFSMTNYEKSFIYSSLIDTLDIANIKAWCEKPLGLSIEATVKHLYINGKDASNLVIPQGTTKIREEAFANIQGITSITIPSSVTEIHNPSIFGLISMTVEWETPISITSDVFPSRAYLTLYVPRGCKAAYEAADYWKDFKEIKEYGDGNATIAMGSSGIATYSNNSDLNFTGVSGLKAYIASGFNPATGKLTMTRVYEVPAGEGLILKGAADSYEVPYGETSAYYANLLVGVPTATTVSPTDGSYTNFILANDEVNGICFYPLASAGEIGPNKAYLQLPTSILPAASRSLRMVFEDEEEEATGISSMKAEVESKPVFDLQGRRVMKPTRGLYIKDGKKIMVK